MTILNIRERRISDVTILDLEGRIKIGDESISFRNAIRQLLAEGKNKILLNLKNVTHIDSGGLGELISGYVALHKAGGNLKLLHLNQKVHELMTITKLLTVFDIYDDESAAVDSFGNRDSEADKPQPPSISKVNHKPDTNDLWPREPDLFKLFRSTLEYAQTRFLNVVVKRIRQEREKQKSLLLTDLMMSLSRHIVKG